VRKTAWPALALVCLLLCCVTLRAQQEVALPDAPSSNGEQVRAAQTAGLGGLVNDGEDVPIAGALVTLTGASGGERKTVTDADGAFHFDGVPAGGFRIMVKAAGFADTTATGKLAPGEQQEMPPFALRVAELDTQVDAISQVALAEQQLKVEEHQRLLGVLPNFYVTYDHNAVPLTARQKYKLEGKLLIDPVNIAVTGILAGVQQERNTFSGYGQGAAGYAKRFGAGYADFAVGTGLGGAVLAVLFHQDPRYFYKGTGSVWRRGSYALATAVIAKGDNGKWQPAYASLLGDFAAGAISNIYYPASDRNGAKLTFENGGLSVLSDGISNVVQEFLLKHLTPGAPKGP